MNPYFFLGVLAITIATAECLQAQSPASKIASAKGWLNNFEAARTQAQKTGKPLLVVFRCDP